jgi:hypothetical protein
MIRAIRLVRKRSELSDQEFKWSWLLHHGPVVREAIAHSPLVKATASFNAPVQIEEYGEGQQVPVALDFDGMEALHFPTVPHLREALQSGVLAALDESLDRFADGASSVPRLVTLEEAMVDRPDRDQVLNGYPRQKLLRTLRRREDIDLYQFRDHWHNHHRVIETGGTWRGPAPLTNVSFSIGQTIADGELREVREEDGLMNNDGVIEIFSAWGVDLLPGYKLPFPPEVRRDELNFLSMELPIRRTIMHEYLLS